RAVAQNSMPPVYEIKTDTASVDIPDSCWQMLGDANGDWTINQVTQSPLSEKFHRGSDISDSSIETYWVRFTVKNSMTHEARITMTRSGYSFFFDLYTKEDSGWRHQRTGPFVPWSERDGIRNNYQIPLVIDAGKDLLVYQRRKFSLRQIPNRLSVSLGFT